MLQDAFNKEHQNLKTFKDRVLAHTDLGLDLHNSLPNCDDHSLIGQHAFQVVQQLLQSGHKAADIALSPLAFIQQAHIAVHATHHFFCSFVTISYLLGSSSLCTSLVLVLCFFCQVFFSAMEVLYHYAIMKDSKKLQSAMHAKQRARMDQEMSTPRALSKTGAGCVLHTCLLLTVATLMTWHRTDAISRQGVMHLGLPSPKVWVGILVVPHQSTLLHIKVAAIGGLSIHLHHPVVHQAQL